MNMNDTQREIQPIREEKICVSNKKFALKISDLVKSSEYVFLSMTVWLNMHRQKIRYIIWDIR